MHSYLLLLTAMAWIAELKVGGSLQPSDWEQNPFWGKTEPQVGRPPGHPPPIRRLPTVSLVKRQNPPLLVEWLPQCSLLAVLFLQCSLGGVCSPDYSR